MKAAACGVSSATLEWTTWIGRTIWHDADETEWHKLASLDLVANQQLRQEAHTKAICHGPLDRLVGIERPQTLAGRHAARARCLSVTCRRAGALRAEQEAVARQGTSGLTKPRSVLSRPPGAMPIELIHHDLAAHHGLRRSDLAGDPDGRGRARRPRRITASAGGRAES